MGSYCVCIPGLLGTLNPSTSDRHPFSRLVNESQEGLTTETRAACDGICEMEGRHHWQCDRGQTNCTCEWILAGAKKAQRRGLAEPLTKVGICRTDEFMEKNERLQSTPAHRQDAFPASVGVQWCSGGFSMPGSNLSVLCVLFLKFSFNSPNSFITIVVCCLRWVVWWLVFIVKAI